METPSIAKSERLPNIQFLRQWWFWGVLILALSLRIGGAIWWQEKANSENVLFRFGDSHSYWTLAKHIARGEPYQYGGPNASIFRGPVYPLVLATVAWVENEHTAVFLARMIGAVLGTISVGLVMLISSRLAQAASNSIEVSQMSIRSAAMVSGLLAAGYPGAIGMSVTILSEGIFCPLMLLQFWMIDIAINDASNRKSTNRKKYWGSSILAGMAAAAAILARPSWLLFMPMQAFSLLIFGTRRWVLWRWLILCGVAAAATMSPWWVRNAMITGKFVPTTLQVGPSLYDGLHPGASGASDEGMEFVTDFIEQQQLADLQATAPLESTFEYRLNHRMSQAALHWAWENPYSTGWLAVVKFGRTWSLWPSASQLGSPWIRLSETVSTIVILVLAVIGSRRYWNADRRPQQQPSPTAWRVASLWMPCLYFTLLHMIFIGSVRYRQPAILVLTCIAGVAVLNIIDKIKNDRRSPKHT